MTQISVIVVSVAILGTLGGLAYVHANRDEPMRVETPRVVEAARGPVETPSAPQVSTPAEPTRQIETDDVESEVARLEKLGAKRIEKVQTWWVMEAPTGQRFCVIRPQREQFPADLNSWP